MWSGACRAEGIARGKPRGRGEGREEGTDPLSASCVPGTVPSLPISISQTHGQHPNPLHMSLKVEPGSERTSTFPKSHTPACSIRPPAQAVGLTPPPPPHAGVTPQAEAGGSTPQSTPLSGHVGGPCTHSVTNLPSASSGLPSVHSPSIFPLPVRPSTQPHIRGSLVWGETTGIPQLRAKPCSSRA